MFCFVAAALYGATAVQAGYSGVTTALVGKTEVEHRRDDSESRYWKFFAARCLLAGGLASMGVLMNVLATKFEKLEDANKEGK
jgi:hypothetical protein